MTPQNLSLTHGKSREDLNPTNNMVRDGRITGIVDWGAVGYSVPAREYICMQWMALDPECRQLTRCILPADEYESWETIHRQMMAYPCN